MLEGRVIRIKATPTGVVMTAFGVEKTFQSGYDLVSYIESIRDKIKDPAKKALFLADTENMVPR